MLSRDYKLKALRHFYFNVTQNDMRFKCPFKKEISNLNNMSNFNNAEYWFPCSELCGSFPELGDVRKACPCKIHGPMMSMLILERLLIKEGYLDSKGRYI